MTFAPRRPQFDSYSFSTRFQFVPRLTVDSGFTQKSNGGAWELLKCFSPLLPFRGPGPGGKKICKDVKVLLHKSSPSSHMDMVIVPGYWGSAKAWVWSGARPAQAVNKRQSIDSFPSFEEGAGSPLADVKDACSAPKASSRENYRSTANKRQSPGTPFRGGLPRSLKRNPEPATRSLTVLDTRTSLGPASDATRAPM